MSLAETVISVLKSLETGQPVSAFFTAVSNLALSASGILATRSRWLFVMEKASPTFSSEMVQVVSSFSATMPCPPNWAESAMVNQPACAAASNSSGLVPTPFSKRVLKEYCVCFRTPLSVEMAPLPVFKSPCQTADPLRCMLVSPLKIATVNSTAYWIHCERREIQRSAFRWSTEKVRGIAWRHVADLEVYRIKIGLHRCDGVFWHKRSF